MVTLAATIPKAKMYSDGYISNTFSVDFSEIMNAGNTTKANGMTGDMTLVPYNFCFIWNKRRDLINLHCKINNNHLSHTKIVSALKFGLLIGGIVTIITIKINQKDMAGFGEVLYMRDGMW